MERRRRQQIAIGALATVLLGGVLYVYWPRTTATTGAASNVKGTSSRARAQGAVDAPDVHLEALNEPRPKPDDANRNLFRFKPKPLPPPPPMSTAPPRPATPPPPITPPGPPPPPDIPLKFAGTMTQGSHKVAILLDSLGHPIYAREGETIEGRYKLWRIGVESIDISYLDGRGRKTIRQSGS